MNYTELRIEVARLLNRTDLTASVPVYIERAEAFLFRELNIREIETSVTGAAAATISLPSDFFAVSRLVVSLNGVTETLLYKTEQLTTSGAGTPASYTLESNQLKIFPSPSGGTYTLYYTPDVSPLSDTTTTNWVLQNAPDLYLYASVLEGARDAGDMEKIRVYSDAALTSLTSAKSFAERRAYPLRGVLQIKPYRG